MTNRRNKDKEIEELKARNTYLENKNKIFTSWKNMSDKERLFLVLLWVVVVILIAFMVTLSLTNTTKNPIETKEDYERIIGTLEDREWKVSESTLKNLQTLIPQTKGEASTALEVDRITLTILISNGDSYTLTFTYRNGRIISLFKGEIIYLEYTETVYGGGKTLTLYYRNEKIVFKEKR
ncbi:MAG: hypothetical protein ACI4NI_02395 [Candidatus Ornithospirochaeta sp.]